MQVLVHGADRAARQLRDVLQAEVGSVPKREHGPHVALEPVERAKELVAIGDPGERINRVRALAGITDAVHRTSLGLCATLVVCHEVQCNRVDPGLLAALVAVKAPAGADDAFERVTHDLLRCGPIASAIHHKGVQPLRMLGEKSLDVVVAHALSMIPDRGGKCSSKKDWVSTGKIRPGLVLQDMTNFDHDDLPPDLADLGRRMRNERPAAENDALDRMKQRAHASSRQSPRRAPRRTFAVSLATMLAMVSVTGVAAAGLFGLSFGSIGKAFMNSNQQIGTASNQALRAPATSTNSRLPATSGSPLGSIGSLTANRPNRNRPNANRPSALRPTRGGATAPAIVAPPSASLFPAVNPNAGAFQYGPGRLVCRILNALGLRFVARLLGCR